MWSADTDKQPKICWEVTSQQYNNYCFFSLGHTTTIYNNTIFFFFDIYNGRGEREREIQQSTVLVALYDTSHRGHNLFPITIHFQNFPRFFAYVNVSITYSKKFMYEIKYCLQLYNYLFPFVTKRYLLNQSKKYSNSQVLPTAPSAAPQLVFPITEQLIMTNISTRILINKLLIRLLLIHISYYFIFRPFVIKSVTERTILVQISPKHTPELENI